MGLMVGVVGLSIRNSTAILAASWLNSLYVSVMISSIMISISSSIHRSLLKYMQEPLSPVNMVADPSLTPDSTSDAINHG